MPVESETITRFRRYAEACVRLTEDTRFSGQRSVLMEMAETWIDLAEQLAAQATPTAKARR